MNSSAFSRNGIYHNRGNSSQRGRGRSGRGSWRSNNKLQCQLCGRMGHVVMKCYYRFDQSFSGLSQLQGNRPQGFISNLYPFAQQVLSTMAFISNASPPLILIGHLTSMIDIPLQATASFLVLTLSLSILVNNIPSPSPLPKLNIAVQSHQQLKFLGCKISLVSSISPPQQL